MHVDSNLLLSSCFQLAFLVTALFGMRRDRQNESFLSQTYTASLKALCCFSVILAHTGAGEKYCLLGCVHWVAVSLFFLFSGYGLAYNVRHRAGYLQAFYRRLLKVIIPLLLVLALKAAFSCSLWSGGMNYMLVIFLFYIVFFLVHVFCGAAGTGGSAARGRPRDVLFGLNAADLLLLAFTLAYSLFIQRFHDARLMDLDRDAGLASIPALLGWGCQSLGFAYGIILAGRLESFKAFLSRRRNKVLLFACCPVLLPVLAFSYLGARNILFVSWKEYVLRAVMTLCLLLVAAALSQGRSFGNPVICFVGRLSGPMFLLHGFVIELLERSTGLCQRQPGLFVVLVYLLTLCAGWLLQRLLDLLYRLLRI